MPIVDVECVRSDEEVLTRSQIECLANELGDLFGRNPGTTWVKVRNLSLLSYAENGIAEEDTPEPTFVRIIKRTLPDKQGLSDEAKRIVHVVAQTLSCEAENVHVIYEPEGAGRVAFGGELVNKGDS